MNDSTAAGVFNEAKGKLKQAFGETFNDQSVANDGAADEVKGHAQQTWGSVRDTAHDLTSQQPAPVAVPAHRDETSGHDMRTSVTDAAANAKRSIQHGLDHLEHRR